MAGSKHSEVCDRSVKAIAAGVSGRLTLHWSSSAYCSAHCNTIYCILHIAYCTVACILLCTLIHNIALHIATEYCIAQCTANYIDTLHSANRTAILHQIMQWKQLQAGWAKHCICSALCCTSHFTLHHTLHYTLHCILQLVCYSLHCISLNCIMRIDSRWRGGGSWWHLSYFYTCTCWKIRSFKKHLFFGQRAMCEKSGTKRANMRTALHITTWLTLMWVTTVAVSPIILSKIQNAKHTALHSAYYDLVNSRVSDNSCSSPITLCSVYCKLPLQNTKCTKCQTYPLNCILRHG